VCSLLSFPPRFALFSPSAWKKTVGTVVAEMRLIRISVRPRDGASFSRRGGVVSRRLQASRISGEHALPGFCFDFSMRRWVLERSSMKIRLQRIPIDTAAHMSLEPDLEFLLQQKSALFSKLLFQDFLSCRGNCGLWSPGFFLVATRHTRAGERFSGRRYHRLRGAAGWIDLLRSLPGGRWIGFHGVGFFFIDVL